MFRSIKITKNILSSLLILLLAACGEQKVEHNFTPQDIKLLSQFSLSNLSSPPKSISNKFADNQQAAKLGHRLFFDKALSSNGEVACSSCHQPDRYFTDGLKVSKAVGQSRRNAPSVLSGSWSEWLYWDGRKDSVWSQALGPLEDPEEHNFTRVKVVQHLARLYRQDYELIFGELLADKLLKDIPNHATPLGTEEQKRAWNKFDQEIQGKVNRAFANVGKSLMAYQRQLIILPAPFDQFVKALRENNLTRTNALNQSQLNGLKLFLGRANCVSCHNGPLFSNFEFHNVGAPESNKEQVDLGRYSGIKKLVKDEFTCLSDYSDANKSDCLEMRFLKKQGPELVGAFRTPSLRNIAKTAPYMQTGQFDTLEEVVQHYDSPIPPYYNRKQHPSRPHFDILPLKLSADSKQDLVEFLKTLTSPLPKDDPWWEAPKSHDSSN